MPKETCEVFFLKTAGRFLAEYCNPDLSASQTGPDAVLGCPVTTLDCGRIFWSMVFDRDRLAALVAREASAPGGVARELDSRAVEALPKAQAILGALAVRLPEADELWFCFRVISRCAGVVSRSGLGYQANLARGLLPDTFHPYRLSDILAAAADPESTAIGRLLAEMLHGLPAVAGRPAFLIGIRSDAELQQAILMGSLLKRRFERAVIVLETANANEQYDFTSWLELFAERRQETARHLDFFIPFQDYRNALRHLLRFFETGQPLPAYARANLFQFDGRPGLRLAWQSVPCREAGGRAALSPDQLAEADAAVEDCFARQLRGTAGFPCAGRRTLATRLSPQRCHWASCTFCAINSQHLLPRASADFDDRARRWVSQLVDVLRSRHVESLVLMDEAVPLEVLLGLAGELIRQGIDVLYRARARFSDRLDAAACRLLYASGCRYLGLGLEAAAERVNRLAHKLEGPAPDYDRIVDAVEGAGIRCHVYCILGFPTETRAEISRTCDFLIRNINKHAFFTASANPFYLMKGTVMAREPERFGITRVEADDVSLTWRFDEPERLRNDRFVRECVQSVNQQMFLPHADDKEAAEAFWYFLDQTAIFYVQKVACSANPYRALASAALTPLPAAALDQVFSRASFLFEVVSAASADGPVLCDWVTNNYARLPPYLYAFVVGYSDTLTVRENIEAAVPPAARAAIAADFPRLVQLGFFTPPRRSPGSSCPLRAAGGIVSDVARQPAA